MAHFTDEEDLRVLREAGRRLARVMKATIKEVKPGVSTKHLNDVTEKMIREMGDLPALLGYKPYGANRPYPATICISVNSEVVHGIPTENDQILKEGDIVGLDLVIAHEKKFVDMALTVPVGEISKKAALLIEVTKRALSDAINAAQVGNHINDISIAIEKSVKGSGFSIVEELGGHGVGNKVHEAPYIANVSVKERGPVLKPGMVLAIEPIVNEGSKHVVLEDDGYTFRTADKKLSAHFEHTILITDNGPEIITLL